MLISTRSQHGSGFIDHVLVCQFCVTLVLLNGPIQRLNLVSPLTFTKIKSEMEAYKEQQIHFPDQGYNRSLVAHSCAMVSHTDSRLI